MEGKRYANGSAKKITKLGLQNCSAQILPAGRTILFTSRAGIGKMAILKRPGSTNQGFQSLVLNQEINPYFIYSLCDEIKEKAESVAAGSTFLEISGKALGNIEILMPKELEQNKVSNYFLKLDNLITLHQRKYFCSNNLIFTITTAWEQRKLNNYLIVSDEKNSENLYKKEDVLSVSGDFGIVNQIEFQGRSFAGTSVLNYGVVHKGDVVYTKSPLKATPYGIIKTNKGSTGIVSVLYGVYHTKENANADFIQVYFEQNARLNNYLRPLVNKGAKNTLLISDEEALNGEVNFAPSLNEQLKISVVFNSIDNLITLHQRECFFIKKEVQNVKFN